MNLGSPSLEAMRERVNHARLSLASAGASENLYRLARTLALLPEHQHSVDWIDLRADALGLRSECLFRIEQYASAAEADAQILALLTGQPLAERRVQALSRMAFACMQVAQHETAFRCAMAAFQLAMQHNFKGHAVVALERTAMCYSLLGDLTSSERIMTEALELARQVGDDAFVRSRLSNFMFLSWMIHDNAIERQDWLGAKNALERVSDIAREGNQLIESATGFEACLWRSNHAGWLRRSKEYDRARCEFEAVYATASQQGWVSITRHASLELAYIAHANQHPADALVFARRTLRDESDPDGYGLNERAHALMVLVLHGLGRPDQAARHALAGDHLRHQKQQQRLAVAERLLAIQPSIDAALHDCDKLRIEAEIERMRETRGDAF